MIRFTSIFVLVVLLLVSLAIPALAQNEVFQTNTPAPVDDGAVVESIDQPVTVDEDTGILADIISTLTLALGILLFSFLALVIVVFLFFVRSIVPTLLSALPPEWAPFIIGAASAVDQATMAFALKLKQRALETETELDDKLIERIFGGLEDLPPLPDAQ